jgi:hypothetical protein
MMTDANTGSGEGARFIEWLQAGRGQVLKFDHGHAMPSPTTAGAGVGRSFDDPEFLSEDDEKSTLAELQELAALVPK